MSSARPGPVVAGFSGMPGSRQALRWACREAAVRRRELHLVRAFSTPLEELTRIHFPAEPVDFGLLHADVEHEVSGTVAECARDWPELTITGETRLGHPALVLREASRNCALVLDGAGITGLFDVSVDGVVAAELGLRGKPDPATYLEAARRLGCAPRRSAVLEDAVVGVRAGRAGGFGLVIGVATAADPGSLRDSGADVVVRSLRAVVGASPCEG